MHFCRCHYTDADLDGLNLLFLNEDDDEMSVMPKAAWEMFGCFTKVPECQVIVDACMHLLQSDSASPVMHGAE